MNIKISIPNLKKSLLNLIQKWPLWIKSFHIPMHYPHAFVDGRMTETNWSWARLIFTMFLGALAAVNPVEIIRAVQAIHFLCKEVNDF